MLTSIQSGDQKYWLFDPAVISPTTKHRFSCPSVMTHSAHGKASKMAKSYAPDIFPHFSCRTDTTNQHA